MSKPSNELRRLVALKMADHMGLPDDTAPAVLERAAWWLRKTYQQNFGRDEVPWLNATITQITRKPRHFKRLNGGPLPP